MSNNKRSSVEVLFSEMYNIIAFYAGDEQDAQCERIKQLSEAMHEEEIKIAHGSGRLDRHNDFSRTPEQYYNEIYNNHETK